MNDTTLLDAALLHHAEGRRVIAVNSEKKPYRKGWNDFFTRSQTEKEVRQEFSNGAHGLALVLYPACSLGVLDHDGPHAKEVWQTTGIELPETARNISRSGYDHLFFRMPANTPSGMRRSIRLVEAPCDCKDDKGPKPCGVDLLVNGYVIAPPTPGYREDPDRPLESAAVMPQAVLEIALKKQKEDKERPTGDAKGKVNHGQRKATACSLAGTMRKRGMSLDAIRAALKADSEARFSPPLDNDEIEDVLKSAVKWLDSHQDNAAQDKSESDELITLDTIMPEAVNWLWDDRVPIGKLTQLAGDPGVGKSFLSLKIASAISRGEALPGHKKPQSPSSTLILSIEDGYGDTMRPRVDAMGGDPSRIIVPKRGFIPSTMSIERLEGWVKRAGPALVIFDPIISFTGKADTSKASEVRAFLSPLMILAETYSFACIIIIHLNKQPGSKAIYRGNGSIDFVAACRSAFLVAEDPEQPERRVLAHVKNTIKPRQPSLSFYIADNGGFRWGEKVSMSADELLAPSGNREAHQLEAAKSFLTEVLPMASERLFEDGERRGISKRTLFRAKDAMGIRAKKMGLDGSWVWLPGGVLNAGYLRRMPRVPNNQYCVHTRGYLRIYQ
jgi:DNA repair protein RadA/Sms